MSRLQLHDSSRRARHLLVIIALLSSLGSCTSSTDGRSAPGPGHLAVDLAQDGRPFDRRLLGSNVPAWLSTQLLSDPVVVERTRALDLEVLRMPGGSWSNGYDWLACEQRTERCIAPGALGPSDFLAFLAATGAQGMWTVNVNGTPQEAAALVAFFNARVDDERPIGVDRRGRDWRTAGHWARMRAAAGHEDPVAIDLWEVGNEVYAARGAGCAAWAWEEVWTCDGRTYVEGDGEHEGYLAFREAMRAVDPDIAVGAVGVDDQGAWSGWGDEVIAAAGSSLDFYAIHHYGFTGPPEADGALARTVGVWSEVLAGVRSARVAAGLPPSVDVAVTEHNLVAVQDDDADALMASPLGALYLADAVGQMALAGVSMANQWNLANGRAPSGTDYGLIDAVTGQRNAQYYGLAMWRWFGDELLDVRTDIDAGTTLSAYAARRPDGAVTVLAVNKTDDVQRVTLELEHAPGSYEGRVRTVNASGPTATEVRFNGSTTPSDDLSVPAPSRIAPFERQVVHEFPPWSISLVELRPAP